MKKKLKEEEKKTVQEESVGINYRIYKMGQVEKLISILGAGTLLFVFAYVFYQNVILSIFIALFAVRYPKIRTKQMIKKRKKKLLLQFKDMLYSLSSSIGSGSSPERAISLTLTDMENQYDEDTFIVKELRLMEQKISMNENIEDVFLDLAQRSGVEDIYTFANIFEISKQTGGNLIEIMRHTVNVIADKIEIKREMDTLISGQKMEQKVLTIIPVVLMLFMTHFSKDFMEPMFHSITGRVISTISLAIILVGNLWAKKIADVEM